MQNPLVSVIIPVYNTEAYISMCIDSVINQTYPNLEIIIINDGSNDNSLNIINQYSKKHPNIRVISQKNLGNSIARNRGIESADGEYISF
ncbi:glycosyltransferase family 2 protein [Robertmurraya massiliosenegalensis]|uniref:glycosyltransferase family 2 protein n=1 Tax=Robertmurraya massiliosenegalensis TaxID=1287657 RepID=UPI00035C33E2|nr:glycosyltransferase [Robertmurraya massiliosenegalensis]